nr:MAG: capsid protein [Cressdnaviricota sp.]
MPHTRQQRKRRASTLVPRLPRRIQNPVNEMDWNPSNNQAMVFLPPRTQMFPQRFQSMSNHTNLGDDYMNRGRPFDAPDIRTMFDRHVPRQPSFKNLFDPLTESKPDFEGVTKLGKAMESHTKPLSKSLKPKQDRNWIEWFGDKVAQPLGTLIGGGVGLATGGLPGAHAGMALGTGAGGLISRITGSGDYKLGPSQPKYNTLTNEADIPQFKSSGKANIVCHREYITDISGSVGFAAASYALNPAQPATFPWLAVIAENYEEYIIHGMVFEFKSTSADALNSTNTALGTVIMATQYNATNAAFSSKQQMENYEFAMSSRPSINQLHAVECSPRETPVCELYTRTGSVPSGQDQRLYDLGTFYIATAGMQAAAVIGELWVSYHIELLKPKIPGTIGGNVQSIHVQNTGFTNALPLGAVLSKTSGNLTNWGQILAGGGLSEMTWSAAPNSKWLVTISYTMTGTGAATGLTTPTPTGTQGGSIINYYASATGFDTGVFATGINGTTNTLENMLSFVVQNSATGSVAGFFLSSTGVILPGGSAVGSYVDVFITPMDSTIIQ